ncbi:MAG TPA: hypothetical protein DD473_16185 [Planctomycetaceae bacterium]|nr:hypothetical protein [Planctomycetaceae bacterium]
MANKDKLRFSDQLRLAISESGMTRYEIAKQTAIDESSLAKFVHGKRGLSIDSIDRLAEILDLSIVHKDKNSGEM